MEQRESWIQGGTTPAPVSYLHSLASHRADVVTGGLNYVQENYRKNGHATMYLDNNVTVVSQAQAHSPS